MNTILIVDDEKEIVDLIEIYLKGEGFSIEKAYEGKQALELIEQKEISLLILDVMMPGMSGLEVCQRVRYKKNLPIILLSAKSEDIDKIMGLGMGADDYITKPFHPLELIARVKSQLNRFAQLTGDVSQKNCEQVCIRGLFMDSRSHKTTVFEREVDLTPTEFDILFLLTARAGKVFSAEEIFHQVWKEKYLDSNNTVMVHIRKIREKTEENPRKPKFIKTVWGVGYLVEK